VPPAVAGIDVNFCKYPACENFGVPAEIVKFRHTVGTLASTLGTAYGLRTVARNRPAIECLLCEEKFAVKSNLAVAEELTRFSRYLLPAEPVCCATAACLNHSIPVPNRGAYIRHGVTNAGTPRYRCKLCKRTVSFGGRSTKKQRITHHNRTILMLLTNKMPLRRIAKVTGLNAVTLYGKIDFLYRQCLAYAAGQERALLELERERLYISVDRQEHVVNWSRDTDRRNVVLLAVGSADNESGYVFAVHLNFDPSLDPAAVEADAVASADIALPYPQRKYARLWLLQDYADGQVAVAAEKARKTAKAAKGPIGKDISDGIADDYEAAAIREDSEVSELKDEGSQKLPDSRGMQVHDEYSLYGHFQFLKYLLPKVGKLRFFLDRDSGMRAACLAAFAPDIKALRVDAFFVRLAKEMTVDKKRAALAHSKTAFKKAQDANPDLSPPEVVREMMKAEIAKFVSIGKWGDRWCLHPMPNMSEPEKAMTWLTDIDELEPEGPKREEQKNHVANLFLKASQAGIDNFFQRVRRSLNPLERPIHTASKHRRTWHGHSPYNPAMVEKLLGIYRVMHNFVEVGKDGRTPAMRLGLPKAPVDPEEVIYYT